MVRLDNTVIYKKENLYIERMPYDGVIVVDVNAQGIFTLSSHQKDFMDSFPKTYRAYMELCRKGLVKGGDHIKFEEDGYKLYLIVTADKLIGKDRDKQEDIESNTSYSLYSVLTELEKERTIVYSGIINRASNLLSYTHRELNDYLADFNNITWIVCTK